MYIFDYIIWIMPILSLFWTYILVAPKAVWAEARNMESIGLSGEIWAPNLGAKAYVFPAKKWNKKVGIWAMSVIPSSAFTMAATSATVYRSTRSQVKRMKLIARSNCVRMKKASKKSSLGVRVSPKTAETYGRCLNLSYAEAVKEIYLITQACLRLTEGVDF